jgi:hypothetical protein
LGRKVIALADQVRDAWSKLYPVASHSAPHGRGY